MMKTTLEIRKLLVPYRVGMTTLEVEWRIREIQPDGYRLLTCRPAYDGVEVYIVRKKQVEETPLQTVKLFGAVDTTVVAWQIPCFPEDEVTSVRSEEIVPVVHADCDFGLMMNVDDGVVIVDTLTGTPAYDARVLSIRKTLLGRLLPGDVWFVRGMLDSGDRISSTVELLNKYYDTEMFSEATPVVVSYVQVTKVYKDDVPYQESVDVTGEAVYESA